MLVKVQPRPLGFNGPTAKFASAWSSPSLSAQPSGYVPDVTESPNTIPSLPPSIMSIFVVEKSNPPQVSLNAVSDCQTPRPLIASPFSVASKTLKKTSKLDPPSKNEETFKSYTRRRRPR